MQNEKAADSFHFLLQNEKVSSWCFFALLFILFGAMKNCDIS